MNHFIPIIIFSKFIIIVIIFSFYFRDIFIFEIMKALSNGERVELRDVMTFETKIQKKRISLNPRTLEKVEVPEKKGILFKCSKEWKKKLNEKI